MEVTISRGWKWFSILGMIAAAVVLTGCPSSQEEQTAPEQTPTVTEEEAVTEPIAPERPTPEPFAAEPLMPVEPSPIEIAEPTMPLPEEPEVVEIDDTEIDAPLPEEQPQPSPVREAGGLEEPGNPLRSADEPIAEEPQVHSPAAHGEAEDEPFDPVKENGPIFVDWPEQVALAFVITGRQHGYMEPCGCAGLDQMKGGMSRRNSLFKQLRQERGWPVVGLDVGGLAKGYGRQAEIKFHRMVDAVRKMDYAAITLGTSDLKLPAGELAADAADDGSGDNPFISANMALFGVDAELTAAVRIVEAGGRKVGITGVLGKRFQKEIHNDEIEQVDPEAAIEKIMPKLKAEADYLVLLAHATKEESIALAEQFPDFDLVVTAGGGDEPPAVPELLNDGTTMLVEVGEKGMNAVVLALVDDPQRPFLYQRVPLDSRFPNSPDMKRIMAAYQDQLEELGYANLGIPMGSGAPAHSLSELAGKFVGSEKCASCHEESYKVWKRSKHAHAFQTLVELDPPRDFDPECVACHVIGWNPAGYFPYRDGYESVQATPELIDVGCESCHGPGGAHAKAEEGADFELQEKLQKAAILTLEDARDHQCRTCHDGDNSPEFDFDKYWPEVEHYEEE